MAVEFTCSHCGWTARLDSQYAGQSGRCPDCQSAILIPGMASDATALALGADDCSSKEIRPRLALVLATSVVCTILTELVTLWLRFGLGATAAEFNRTAPLVLQVHHMFWSIPLLLLAAISGQRPRTNDLFRGIAAGLVASDLLHHFVVLPLTVGNTGWHWP